jgi:nicotinamidase-related amidase
MRDSRQILQETAPFFEWLADWYDNLVPLSIEEAFPDPPRAAIMVADLILGFCRIGSLASPRIESIVPATVRLIEEAHAVGVRRFVLAQDTHSPNSPEFEAWPPHCIVGTAESRMVPELESLPFSGLFTIIEKNALSAGVDTDLEAWLTRNDDLRDFIVAGDCTDLCTYNLAMFVRMWANATNRQARRVIVDASAVQTYDLPVRAAGDGFPHPGDFTHMYFLYHLALNGVLVASRIESNEKVRACSV